MRYAETTPTTPMHWGQIVLVLMLGAGSALFYPNLLLWAGAMRFTWCLFGGHLGRALLDLLLFALLYLAVLVGPELAQSRARSGARAATAYSTHAPAAEYTP